MPVKSNYYFSLWKFINFNHKNLLFNASLQQQQKSKTFTTPSGAVIDAFGNVLYAPPSATVESEIPQTPPLPQNSTPAPSQPYIPLPPDRTPDPTNRVGCNNQSCSLPDETLCRKVRYGNTAGTFAWYFCRANYPDLWK